MWKWAPGCCHLFVPDRALVWVLIEAINLLPSGTRSV